MTIVLALLIDRWLGEPTARWHPVVWMGRYLSWAGRELPSRTARMALWLGAACWLAGACVVAAVYGYVGMQIARLPLWLEVLLAALLLKPLFSLQMLLNEVCAIEAALLQSVEAGRLRLAMIVSRDTTHLDASEIRESSLESLAENLSDSVVAPLFWFLALGLPGAALYRFANTADAMWGYRGRWEWAGKFAARADDVLNIIPARLTALALLAGRPQAWQLLKRLPREAARTASPNSGWPMAALALALNVRLRKPGVYTLNEAGSSPSAMQAAAALRLAGRTALLVAALFGAAELALQRLVHG